MLLFESVETPVRLEEAGRRPARGDKMVREGGAHPLGEKSVIDCFKR